MKLVNIDTAGGWRVAAVSDGHIFDLNRAVQLSMAGGRAATSAVRQAADRIMPPDMRAWLALGHPERMEAAHQALKTAVEIAGGQPESSRLSSGLCWSETTVPLAPAVPEFASVFAVGLNFPSHVEEAGAQVPKWPIIFAKPRNSIERHNATIPLPSASRRIDYEGELAVVIGAECKAVAEEDALSFVAGYTIANDLSARDWQFRTSEMMIGKALDGFCPLGPYLTTLDDCPDVGSLAITTLINGETRQSASLSEMLFGVSHIVSYISQVITLQPGDAVLMGTPAGTGVTMDPRRWLGPEDVVEIEITGLGRLVTTMAAPTATKADGN